MASSKSVVSKMLVKAFRNLPIQDAKTALLLVPTAADFKSAVRKDPRNCGLSRCVGRMFGATLALFFKGFAYVDMVGEDGIRRVYRYTLGKTAVDQLAAFDRNEAVKVGCAIRLRPPSTARTLHVMRRANKRWKRSDVGKAVVAEAKAQSRLRTAAREIERVNEQYQKVSAAAPASSPKVKEVRQQQQVAQTQLRKARDDYDTAVARSKKVRAVPFKPAVPAKPRQFDLTVRNASGFFSRASAAA